MDILSRIAPTPNGEIHWGNLMNFILTWVYVKQNNGQLLLRFDDIDQARCEERFAHHIKEILHFLGIDYLSERSHQNLKLEEYRSFLNTIPNYVCHCSRQDVFNRSGSYYYDGFCRSRKLTYTSGNCSIRFLGAQSKNDFVLWRKEDIPAYHLTSVKDDIDMKITHVIRGEDLFESSIIQEQILSCLENKIEIKFLHHSLIKNESGEKLSKSRLDGDIYQLVKNGTSQRVLFETLAKRMKLEHENFSSLNDFLHLNLKEYLVERFDSV